MEVDDGGYCNRDKSYQQTEHMSFNMSLKMHLRGWHICQINREHNSGSHGFGGGNAESFYIFDPKCTKHKGAPKKLRTKTSLETTKKKSRGRSNKVTLNSTSSLKDNVSNKVSAEEAQVMNTSYPPPPQLIETQDSMEGVTSLQ